jgi:hypothetical protein
VVDLVDLDVQRERDVVTHELETWLVEQVVEVRTRAGVEVVHDEHVMSLVEQPPGQVRADEAGAAGDQHALGRARSLGNRVGDHGAKCIR